MILNWNVICQGENNAQTQTKAKEEEHIGWWIDPQQRWDKFQ